MIAYILVAVIAAPFFIAVIVHGAHQMRVLKHADEAQRNLPSWRDHGDR